MDCLKFESYSNWGSNIGKNEGMSNAPFEPNKDRLLPDLSLKQEMVLLARTLWREGYNDHLAGHITVNLHDGTLLCNPWLLLWNEFRVQDVIRIDMQEISLKATGQSRSASPCILNYIRLGQTLKLHYITIHCSEPYGPIWVRSRPLLINQAFLEVATWH